MDRISKRHFLKGKEVKKLMAEIEEKLKIPKEFFGKNPKVEVAEFDETKIFILNSRPLVASCKGISFPTLIFNDSIKALSKVVVDMGAVPHVCNGADVMAPGIVELEGKFSKGDLIAVLDEKNKSKLNDRENLLNLLNNTLRRARELSRSKGPLIFMRIDKRFFQLS